MLKRHEVQGHRIAGSSMSGMATMVAVPSMDLAFDMGCCPMEALSCRNVAISHPHLDHIGSIVSHAATRHLMKAKPSRIICHPDLVEPLEKLFQVFGDMQNQELPHSFLPLKPGDDGFKFAHVGNGDYLIKAFPGVHRIYSQGYVVYHVKPKLKAEYHGRKDIAELRAAGVDVLEEVESPELAFVGDSEVAVLDENPVLREVNVLIMESTFVDEKISSEFAGVRGHTHLKELVERADVLKNNAIVLMHFSARYHEDDIKRAVKELPDSLRDRVIPLLDGMKRGFAAS